MKNRFHFFILSLALLLPTTQWANTRKPIRIYVDGVFDLFHCGHINFLRQVKAHGDYLVVVICSDADVASYKRWPILRLEERVQLVEACRYVDEVVSACPLCVTEDLIRDYEIDVVIHGDDFNPATIAHYYGVPIRMGIFKTVPYTATISTTDIIQRIIKRALASGTIFLPQTD